MPVQHSPVKSPLSVVPKEFHDLPKSQSAPLDTLHTQEISIPDEGKTPVENLVGAVGFVTEEKIIYPVARLAAMTRKCNEIKELLPFQNKPNFIIVKERKEQLTEKIEAFLYHCRETKASSICMSEEEHRRFRDWKNTHTKNVIDFLSHVELWLKETEKTLTDRIDDVNPEDSISQVRQSSVLSSSVTSSHAKLRQDKIKLEMQRKLEEENFKLEEQELKEMIQHEKRKLELKKERLRIEAKIKQEELERITREINRSESIYRTRSRASSHRMEQTNHSTKSFHRNTQPKTEVFSAPVVQTVFQLPRNEPDVFNGDDITTYKPFILSFDRTIATICHSDSDKYYYLLRYTEKYPHELVKSCLGPDYSLSYNSARKLLDEQYGSEISLAQSYLDKLDKWPAIKSEDSSALDQFSLYLTSCLNIMSNCQHLNQLNGWKELKGLMMKLPYELRKKFRSKVAYEQTHNRMVVFETFAKFVNAESASLKIPLLGDIRDLNTRVNSRGGTKPKISFTKGTVLSTSLEVEKDCCPCCSKNNHSLDDCFFFLRKSLPNREAFIKSKKLCFGCLMTDSHRTKDCSNKIVCKKCHKLHPSSLHKDFNSKTNLSSHKSVSKISESEIGAQALAASHETSDRIICPSMPVGIRRKGTNEMIITNMAIDTYATACYLDDELLNALNIEGKGCNLSLTTMENNSSKVSVKVVENLEIVSLDETECVVVPKIYAKKHWPFSVNDNLREADVKKCKLLKNVPFKFLPAKIGLLIGINMPQIVKPLEVVNTTNDGPYATRHLFGWAFNGPIRDKKVHEFSCFRTSSNEYQTLDAKIENYFARDFDDQYDDPVDSIDDKIWIEKVSNAIKKLSDNKFEIPLPIKPNVELPDNKQYAIKRLNSLTKRLESDIILHEEYSAFMSDMIDKGFVEEVPEADLKCELGKVWYLPHHGVRHKQKKKLRIVFDCSARFQGTSLNDVLLQGPDLTNNLLGVLLRFREGKIAITADIEKMFYNVWLPREDSNFLRFLWYRNNDTSSDPIEYRVLVHVFGAKSSPSCANYALQQCILHHSSNEDLTSLLTRSFYVDDLIISVNDEAYAKSVLSESVSVLRESGFNLTGFNSNDLEVIQTLPVSKLSKNLQIYDTTNNSIPVERALGILWNPETDEFSFKTSEIDQPFTKRGMLSTIFSIYDPFFIVSPALILAKSLFQKACSLRLDWDTPLPRDLQIAWNSWLINVKQIDNFKIPRNFSCGLHHYSNLELHIFADGSEVAYGCVAYLRFESEFKTVCNNVLSKVRLTPLKPGALKTIPRIELNAAKLSVVLYLKLKKELRLQWSRVVFWTDSSIVLGYISSNAGRFQRFVSNRIAFVRNHTNIEQWRHVPGNQNPADIISRGVKDIKQFTTSQMWQHGPKFLCKSESEWPQTPEVPLEVESEMKKLVLVSSGCHNLEPTEKLLESCSGWLKLRLRVAVILRITKFAKTSEVIKGKISIHELLEAENSIWRFLQNKYFPEVIKSVHKSSLPKKHYLAKFSPFIDENGLLRIGGRLRYSDLDWRTKHPLILPKEPLATALLIEHYHKSLSHMGRETLIANLRTKYYIVGCSCLVKLILKNCLICRKVLGKPSVQYIADLPNDRVSGLLVPFAKTGLDFFGPFLVSRGRGRSAEKRYGVIFTCLLSRACHIEIAHSLNTDSFLNALRRFVSRRGNIESIRSDNGTNFVAGNKEIRESINQWNHAQIDNCCKIKGIDWLFNPPNASHFGGIYEREIRTIRKVLNSLMHEMHNKVSLSDEMLLTLMCEVENTLNCRPLTSVTSDPEDLEALTPNHILRLNFQISFPPGIFMPNDLYLNKRWRQIQYMADLFWSRWRREYLPLLTQRQKWFAKHRQHKCGDLVLVTDQKSSQKSMASWTNN